ncbi:LAMI_0C07756g1_1 [Lachancea mirantina]|uniref:Ras modification protein ERF4 n=1 Tax=Lachancea mirantina TaxID=1230905 RepID=A0A1G4J4Q2_9SACH|nr:LAMI_0C07756g1_1 [Lachancea mirantina]
MLSTLDSGVSKNQTLANPNNRTALFFNYHEFNVTHYTDLDGEVKEHTDESALCVTHFPNVYVPVDSAAFLETRVVRIPRRFETTLDYPTFSSQLPGLEPAAIYDDYSDQEFIPHGRYETQLFGTSSTSPLSNYLTQDQFRDIVETVNEFTRKAYEPLSWQNILNNTLDYLTFNLWNNVISKLFVSPLQELETYVERLNNSDLLRQHSVKLISPRRSAYLSVSRIMSNEMIIAFYDILT